MDKRNIVILGLVVVGAYTTYAINDRWQQRIKDDKTRQQNSRIEVNYLDESVVVVSGPNKMRRLSLRDQTYRPPGSDSAKGASPFQTVEGLPIGVDFSIRYALDAAKVTSLAKSLPENIASDIVEPLVKSVLYKTMARYSAREIFSTKRQEIQRDIETELGTKLANDGIILRAVSIGNVDLPKDYKIGMEKLLEEVLASEKMRYTLELKDKQVKQSELEAQAEKVKREKAAEAAGEEQIIAAKAQAEAMKHILPFKQRQIEQRGLEAEAETIARVKSAEAMAQARRIEAAGEADSRQKLADAEAYRQERIGKIASEILALEGAVVTKNPLLIQKTLADKLSDKITVIIAPPPTDGGFIGAALLGGNHNLKDSGKAAAQATRTVASEIKAQEPTEVKETTAAQAETTAEGQ